MTDQPPDGYRFLRQGDDVSLLHSNDGLVDLCKCGHTNWQHQDEGGRGFCRQCPCTTFIWKCFLIKIN